MATLTLPEERYAELFGPTPAYTPAGGWDNREPDRLVKTHCCFCGVQCGIQLKVKDNKVIGFEPWEEFPVNQGKLCPKGVKRYLQNGHPDRLLSPLIRTGIGFRHACWDEALNNTVEAIRGIQSKYGKDSFAFLGGASSFSRAGSSPFTLKPGANRITQVPVEIIVNGARREPRCGSSEALESWTPQNTPTSRPSPAALAMSGLIGARRW